MIYKGNPVCFDASCSTANIPIFIHDEKFRTSKKNKVKNWNSVLAKNRKKIDAAIDQIFNAGGDLRFRRNAQQPISKKNSGIGKDYTVGCIKMNNLFTLYPIFFSVGPIQLESTQANITQAEIIIIKTTFIQSAPSHGKI